MMKSSAGTYDEFLHYSRLNSDADVYPNIIDLNYPPIISLSEELNSAIEKAYVEMENKLLEFSEDGGSGVEVVGIKSNE